MEILGIVQVVSKAHTHKLKGPISHARQRWWGWEGTQHCSGRILRTAGKPWHTLPSGISAQPKMCSPRRLRGDIAKGRGRLLRGRGIWMSLWFRIADLEGVAAFCWKEVGSPLVQQGRFRHLKG